MRDALHLISTEKTSWEKGQAFVTGEVQQNVFNIIKRSRKNYHSIYTNPIEPATKRRKVFVPLTESIVESIVKRIKLGPKDMRVIAQNSRGFAPAIILRHLVANWMSLTKFGRTLSRIVRTGAIDGTCVVKVVKKDVKGRMVPVVKIVDTLNFLFDPAAEDIEDTATIERHLFTIDELKKAAKEKKWKVDYSKVSGVTNPSQYNPNLVSGGQLESDVKYVVLYERYGKITRAMLKKHKGEQVTKDDEEEWLDGHYVIIWDGSQDKRQVVFMEEYKKQKPYKIWKYRAVSGRGHGKGVGELLLDLQSYLNELINIRLNANRLKHIGLWKVKKNRGINQDVLDKLVSGGVVPVHQLDDIDEMRQMDQMPSSYQDEAVIFNWAQRVSGSFDITRGENLPSDQPATTALIAERGALAGIDMTVKDLGQFLKELFEELVIPEIVTNIKDEEIVTISADKDEIPILDSAIKRYLENEMLKNNPMMDITQIDAKIDEQFRRLGNQRYFKLLKKTFNFDYEVQFEVTDEADDPAVKVRSLIDLMSILLPVEAPLNIQNIARLIIDRMGFDSSTVLTEEPRNEPAQIENRTGRPREAQSREEQLTQALTREVTGSANQ